MQVPEHWDAAQGRELLDQCSETPEMDIFGCCQHIPRLRLVMLLLESDLCLGSMDVQDGCSAGALLPCMVSRS